MAEMALKIEDHQAARLAKVAREHYDGDQNAVVSEALLDSSPNTGKACRKAISELTNIFSLLRLSQLPVIFAVFSFYYLQRHHLDTRADG